MSSGMGMVARVALAIIERRGLPAGSSVNHAAFLADARAAIEALRDPSDDVLIAVSPLHNLPWARERWNAGVDAALQDGENGATKETDPC